MVRNNGKTPEDSPGCQIVSGFASNIIHELSESEDKEEKKSYFLRLFRNGEQIQFCPEGKAIAEGYCPYEEAKKLAFDTFVLSDNDFDNLCDKNTTQKLKTKKEEIDTSNGTNREIE